MLEAYNGTLELVKVYGPALILVAFFLWRDFRREAKLNDRIDSLQKESTHVLLALVKDTSAVIARNTAVMQRLEHILEKK